jgi:hypothetical protein
VPILTDDDRASGRSTVDDVQRRVDMRDRQDRATLRPWLLAHYYVRGYKQHDFTSEAMSPETAREQDSSCPRM